MFHFQATKTSLIFLVLLLHQFVRIESKSSYVDHHCLEQSANLGSNSVYKQNLVKLFSNFSSRASAEMFGSSKVGEDVNKVYGLFQCGEDKDLSSCSECVHDATMRLTEECPFYDEAIVWYDECMLRYAKRSFFSLPEVAPLGRDKSAFSRKLHDEHLIQSIAKNMDQLISYVAFQSSIRHYSFHYTMINNFRFYAVAQCTLDLNENQCNSCLSSALKELRKCCNGTSDGKVFMPSCKLSMSVINILDNPNDVPLWGKSYIIVVTSILVAVFLMNILLCYLRWKKEEKGWFANKHDEIPICDITDIKDLKSLQFEFSIIKDATDNFSEDRKLGEGGFGEVYMGKLGNGEEIAVKMLSRTSEHGTKEFKNEVLLLAKLQHKNLVKLLGFCVSGMEKMLIYELLPNLSLDRFLFGPLKHASLDWDARFKIIDGIARGLLYLHEDSRLKIIHRDLKASNILLDQTMNAKISDFGIAKLFAFDETHGNTMRVVGTYGYMAPEYAMAGQFSVKSDVYSFGVIILEILSGQRNTFSARQPSEGLLYRAWRLWNEDKPLELVDSMLSRSILKEEKKILICIHIGLLCIQEDPINRPRMASVVAALNGQSSLLPPPMQPHVLKVNVATHTNLSSNDTNFENEIQQDQCKSSNSGTRNMTELYPR